MDLVVANKVALVTAASRGLGYACAKALSAEGASVAICSRSHERITSAALRIRNETGRAVFGFKADLTSEADLLALVEETEKTVGGIDILVFNTGNPPAGSFFEIDDHAWEVGVALCLRAPMLLCRRLIPNMRTRRFGRIILLSSVFAREPDKAYVISSTLRSGLLGLAKCLARECAADGICVNTLCLGYFDTPLLRSLAAAEADRLGTTIESVWELWAAHSARKQVGNVREVGSLVSFLASEMAPNLTGAVLPFDGGGTKALY